MKSIKKILILLAITTVATISYAQPPTPGVTPGTGDDVNNPAAPITTSTLLLLSLGGGYVTYKIKNKKK
ncbi:MAG: hypothetical protein LBO06_03320 [Bacteroidales bacterium]|nr:hypothetical protein [Bacteroidales bacterium]